MPEKRYVIVSASHHKKPRAFFLSEPLEGKTTPTWRNCIESSLLFTLEQAKKAADGTPIGCYIVEHNENLTDRLAEGENVRFYRFIGIAADANCEIIGDLPQSKQPKTQAKETSKPQEKPTPKANKTDKELFVAYRILDNGNKYYYLNANHGGSRLINGQFANIFNHKGIDLILKRLNTITPYVWICDKIEPAVESETPAPEADSESKELSEGYIVYTQSAYQSAYIYYCGDDAKHLDERDIKNAVLFPYVTAVEIAKKLEVSSEYSGYTWRVKNKINAAKEETPASEAKKRVGYRLFSSSNTGIKFFFQSGRDTANQIRVDGYAFDLFRAQEDAQFTADILNAKDKEVYRVSDWQVEQVEF